MSIEFQHPSGPEKQKVKLTPVGIAGVALLVALVAVIIGMVVSSQQKNKALAEHARVIDTAVDHAVAVCRNVMATSDDSDRIAGMVQAIDRITAEKDPLAKAGLTNDLIGQCMSIAGERQDFVDELNGARNRVQVAIREYKGNL